MSYVYVFSVLLKILGPYEFQASILPINYILTPLF